MPIPFTIAQFLDVFRGYNEAVWPAQLVLVLLGVGAVVLAALARPAAGRAAAGLLGALWLWTGGVYHLTFFRGLTTAAVLFGALCLAQGALLLWWGAARGALAFRPRADAAGVIGTLLALYALSVYPAVGFALGHRYPAAPTFGVPCPVTILTFALLAWSARPVRWALLAIPLAWAAVGTSAALRLGMYEDVGLTAAAILGTLAARRAGGRRADARVAHAGHVTPAGGHP